MKKKKKIGKKKEDEEEDNMDENGATKKKISMKMETSRNVILHHPVSAFAFNLRCDCMTLKRPKKPFGTILNGNEIDDRH
jgi:hypothetical protein